MNIDPNGTWSWKKFWRGFGITAGIVAAAVGALVGLGIGLFIDWILSWEYKGKSLINHLQDTVYGFFKKLFA